MGGEWGEMGITKGKICLITDVAVKCEFLARHVN